jgi:hypothetical protein
LSKNIHEQFNNFGRVPGEVIGPPRDSDRDEASFFAKLNVTFDSKLSRTITQRDLGVTSPGLDNLSRTPDTASELGNASTIVSETRDIRSKARANQEFEKFVFSKFVNILSTPDLGTEKTLGTRGYTEGQVEATLATEGTAWTDIPVATRTQEFINAPNVVKAFSLIDTPQTRLKMFPQNGTYKLSLNFLTAIEFLSGFEASGVSDPVWEPLTYHTYSQNSNKSLLCRMNRVNMDNLGVRATATGKPVYDSCFIIKPTGDFVLDTLPTFTPPTQPEERTEMGLGVLDDLRRTLSEKNEDLETKLRKLEEIETRISRSLAEIEEIKGNPSNYTPRTDMTPIMTPTARFQLEYWQDTLYDEAFGLYGKRTRVLSDIHELKIEISSLRTRLRRATGSDMIRFEGRSEPTEIIRPSF